MGRGETGYLEKFFEKIKNMGFFERLFSWNSFRKLSYDAHEEFVSLKNQSKSNEEKDSQLEKAQEKLERLQEKEKINERKIAEFEATKEQRLKEYEEKMSNLLKLEDKFEKKERKLQDEREIEIQEKFEKMKEQWKNHEDIVEQKIKTICSKYTLSYIPKSDIPFKGSPDNCIQIAGEYIIFDAKSPKDESLDNFPRYIKSQTEQASKYAKQQNVRKEIFLVVPSNTIDSIRQTSYNLVDYSVFVITADSLEPIILALRKIEDYEFAEQLSPEERDHICRIIGKFAHTSKRRIQVDHFFAKEFIDILSKCYDLPKDILEGSVEAEKSGMLNPPLEKRAKQISSDDIKEESKRIKKEAESKNIYMDSDFSDIEKNRLERD